MACQDWPIKWPKPVADYDEALVELAKRAAQETLWGMTGRTFGVCSTTERYRVPSADRCLPSPMKSSVDGQWRNVRGGLVCCRIPLDNFPAREVTEVRLYGQPIAPTEYMLERGRYLMRIGSCWPADADCEVAPIEVDYSYGRSLPNIAPLAMGELAYEFLTGFAGKECRLPTNATSITRNGVTITRSDPQVLIDQHRLGLPISDAWIRQANPSGLREPSRVYSPDLPRRA